MPPGFDPVPGFARVLRRFMVFRFAHCHAPNGKPFPLDERTWKFDDKLHLTLETHHMNETTSSMIAGQSPVEIPLAGPPPGIQSEPIPAASSAMELAAVSPPSVRPRLWPMVTVIALQWLLIEVPMWLGRGETISMLGIVMGPAVGLIGFLGCWLFFSRVPRRDRWLAMLTWAMACAVAIPCCHYSLRWFPIAMYAPPIVLTAWLLWLLATPFLAWPVRRVGLLIVLVLVCGYFPLLRFKGVYGWLTPEKSEWSLAAFRQRQV